MTSKMTEFRKIDDFRWELPATGNMRVPGRIFASEQLWQQISADKSVSQVANVACLPGIVGYSMAMPDIHWGYGFPIGGVAAFDMNEGVISPGGVGYDINCGVRLIATDLEMDKILPKIKELSAVLFNAIPSGVGSSGAIRKLSFDEMKKVVRSGAKWAVEHGFGSQEDLVRIEDEGCMDAAEPGAISDRAYERGKDQLGTLGSGNHFLEIDVISEIYDKETAAVFGLKQDFAAFLIHTGSRGFGYQICDDYLHRIGSQQANFGFALPDRQLAAAPIKSQEGHDYYSAMAGAANYAKANRQIIQHLVIRAVERFFGTSAEKLGIRLVYDVAHNTAAFEEHQTGKGKTKLCVHRKGATRSLPAGHQSLPEIYRAAGQPVIIPGNMGDCSFVLAGVSGAGETFNSSCHGAGRVLSRGQAIRDARGRSITEELSKQGILVMARERGTLAEEMPEAYKNVKEVVSAVAGAGLCKKVAKLKPVAVTKG